MKSIYFFIILATHISTANDINLCVQKLCEHPSEEIIASKDIMNGEKVTEQQVTLIYNKYKSLVNKAIDRIVPLIQQESKLKPKIKANINRNRLEKSSKDLIRFILKRFPSKVQEEKFISMAKKKGLELEALLNKIMDEQDTHLIRGFSQKTYFSILNKEEGIEFFANKLKKVINKKDSELALLINPLTSVVLDFLDISTTYTGAFEQLRVHNDTYFAMANKMELSYSSVARPEFGINIYLHELAHGIFDEMFQKSIENKPKIIKIRKCLSDNYQHIPSHLKDDGKIKLPGIDKRWTEEDYADTFSSLVNTKKNNFLCNLRLTRKYSDKDLKFNNIDHHAPNFWRMMLYELHLKKSLPQSCQRVLKSNKIHMKKCI